MPLALTFVDDWPEAFQTAVEQIFAAALSELPEDDMPTGTINLKLVDDVESKALNAQYNGDAYATDVLTFSYVEEGNVPEGELADIAISTETAARQAEAAGTPLDDEIALLALHGLLHVLGFDHQTGEAKTALNQLQATIMTSAGFTYREFAWKE